MGTITKSIRIGKLTCDCTSAGSRRTAYVIVPMTLEEGSVLALVACYHTNIVVVHGFDWDDDMTPWPAPGVLPEDADFKGEAAAFLNLLHGRIIPEAECIPGMEASEGRILIGVSLSGLFALWAWMQGEDFVHIGCISGSFWYDGFAEWFCNEGVRPKQGNAYFSLGESEGGKRDHPRFRTVREDTMRVINALGRSGIHTRFKPTAGNHYAPFFPRLEKAFAALTDSW